MIDFDKYYIRDDYDKANEGVGTGLLLAGWFATLCAIIGVSSRVIKNTDKKERETAHRKALSEKSAANREKISKLYPSKLTALDNGEIESFTVEKEYLPKILADIKKLQKGYKTNPVLIKEVQDNLDEIKAEDRAEGTNYPDDEYEVNYPPISYNGQYVQVVDGEQFALGVCGVDTGIAKALKLKYHDIISAGLLDIDTKWGTGVVYVEFPRVEKDTDGNIVIK